LRACGKRGNVADENEKKIMEKENIGATGSFPSITIKT